MSDELGSVDAPAIDTGKTSDQILAEIEAIKSNQVSESPARPDSEVVSAPEVGDAPESKMDKQPQTEAASDASEDTTAPLGESSKGQGKADINEWMKKKGFRSVEDMANSLRNLERELSRRPAKGLDETRPPAPDYQIQTPPPQPRYYPPQPNIEEIAKQYNLPAEDFERVMKVSKDISEFNVRMAVTPLAQEVQRLNAMLQKKASDEELERDPAYRNRLVMKEMYQIMESDPSIRDTPDPRRAAYQKALINLGRKYVDGIEGSGVDQEERSGLPTTPPPVGKTGQGSKGSHMKTVVGKMTQEKFNSLSAEQMEKYLAQHGVVRTDTF